MTLHGSRQRSTSHLQQWVGSLAAGITDTAHHHASGLVPIVRGFLSSRKSPQDFFRGGGSGHSEGDQSCLSRLVARRGRSDKARHGGCSRKSRKLPAVVLSMTRSVKKRTRDRIYGACDILSRIIRVLWCRCKKTRKQRG